MYTLPLVPLWWEKMASVQAKMKVPFKMVSKSLKKKKKKTMRLVASRAGQRAVRTNECWINIKERTFCHKSQGKKPKDSIHETVYMWVCTSLADKHMKISRSIL